MATRTLQPSEYEIQREVEALRDIRRRSTTPGALTIDPDLPNQSPPSSPTTTYWTAGSPATPSRKVSDSSSSSHEGSSSSHRSKGGASSRASDTSSNPTDDPFHLFWVPASLHPEIAPAEFRAFLKEHSRTPLPDEESDTPQRSNSVSSLTPASSGLGRKRSMLSRQYRPSENDNVEEEEIVPLKRSRSSLYGNRGPQLTINDLQKLEELAEEASESDDPSKLRNVLRRSLSLNLSPSAIDQMDEMPEMGDEADAPIIVPPPGQILRRAARTKIRKPGLPGDGGGHRFGASRRGAPPRTPTATTDTRSEARTSSEFSSSDHGDIDSSALAQRRQTFSDDGYGGNQRPDSFSEEASIYDAYARDDDEEEAPPVVVTPPPPAPIEQPISPPPLQQSLPLAEPEVPPVQPALLEALGPVIHQPQPQRLLNPQPSQEFQQPSRTPSPLEPAARPQAPETPPTVYVPQSPQTLPSTTPSPPSQPKAKDKRLFKWGGDKTGKKASKEKDRENRERASAEKEKESGFFGSLFGGKKKQDSDFPPALGAHGVNAGREAAQALLGASKSSKSYVPPTSPGLAPAGPNSYARYPIHVERAIYRLSHIKLANPRRPLYEQVLISNLMFWYLGVINKAQNPSPPASAAPTVANAAAGTNGAPTPTEKEEAEREQREKEAAERAEKERMERERLEKEQREREREMESKKKESGRRGSLTKTPAGGAAAGGRRAEMPIRGPQYEMQHRVMEQEYGGYNGGPPQQGIPMGRQPPAPATANGVPQPYPRMQPQQQQQAQMYSNTPPKIVQPQQQQLPDHYYYPPPEHQPQQSRLPPGAMPPADQNMWMSQQQTSSIPMGSPSGPPPSSSQPRRSRSPPPSNHGQPMALYNLNTSQESLGNGGNRPGRSLSATATTSPGLPPANGKVRKGHSAHAVPPGHGRRPRTSEGRPNGEEEDVPLAVWQQQRRK
ncbi:hypothetical protein BDQ12DRAFT_681577 [Crucibulum laeve]|uniref:Protein Zds1 C-terminal domain-containing protein n=1 Tax=Crucibulum laeve TaxID=68775 RepID=A0A5C3M6I7_9AGAR|nr:hypothetical protein BDQ12DRAFT_681577 [Crucibulum laeve]